MTENAYRIGGLTLYEWREGCQRALANGQAIMSVSYYRIEELVTELENLKAENDGLKRELEETR